MRSSVRVSPIATSDTFLIPAMTKPTSPAESESTGTGFGVKTPSCSTSCVPPLAMRRTFIPGSSLPSTTWTRTTTPRYWSNQESKTRPRKGPSGSPLGGGTLWTIASRISSMPTPILAEAGIAPEASIPMTCSICSLARSGSAPGRSILLSTGMISSPASEARWALARVWASTPWLASTTRSAPWQAASERETS